MNKGELKFVIGPARSGKSTYCDLWVRFFIDQPKVNGYWNPRVIVCADDIRLAVTGERFNKDAEPVVWTVHTYMIKSLLTRGHDVIIDGTNTTEDSYWRILNIDPDATYKVFDTPVDICEQRARDTGQLDLIEYGVIRRHHDQLRQHDVEGIDNVISRIRARVKQRWGLG